MADQVPVQNEIEFINGIEFISGSNNILLVAPHGVETKPYDDEKTAELTRAIQQHLKCSAIINPTFRKPKGNEIKKRNNGQSNFDTKVLDLNDIEQAEEHPIFIPKIKEMVNENGSTYVFWIHGIDDNNIKDQAKFLKNFKESPDQLHALIGYGQGPDRSIPVIKRTDDNKADSPSIEKETAESFAQLLTQNGMNTELTSPKGKNFCARSSKNMNQWFLLKGYDFEQVRSLQLEIRQEGFRTDDKIKDTAKLIASAISALLPEVLEKEIVSMDDVDDEIELEFLPEDDFDFELSLELVETKSEEEKIEEAYHRLKNIFVKHVQNAMLECGQYLIETFYDGNYELAQEKKFTRNKSLAKLIERIQQDAAEKGDAPSRTWLYDAVNLATDYHRYQQKQLPSVYGQLGHSHKVNLTSAPDEIKSALVLEAAEKQYTVAKLRERIREEKDKLNPDLVSLKEAMSIKKLGTLKPKQLKALKAKTEGLVQKVQDEVKLYQENLKRIERVLEKNKKRV